MVFPAVRKGVRRAANDLANPSTAARLNFSWPLYQPAAAIVASVGPDTAFDLKGQSVSLQFVGPCVVESPLTFIQCVEPILCLWNRQIGVPGASQKNDSRMLSRSRCFQLPAPP